MGRAPCCAKVGLKRGRWSTEEDRILVEYITVNGEGSWRSLPKNSGLLRCGKSCRLRWLNYLRADVKRGNISKEEEETIIKLQTSMGNRWSLIASHLPGRTDNEIKNYWNSYLSRTVDSVRRMGMVALADANARNPGIGCVRRKGGRTRRSSMKKKNSTSSSSSTRARKMRESRENGENYQATKEILDVEYLGLSDEIRGLLDPTQGVDIGPWPIEEEGEISGVMSSSDQEREGGALVVGGPLDLGGVVGLGEEEVGSDQSSDQVEKMLLDWELGMGANLWDEGEGMMCPWPWEFGDGGELGHQGMEGGGPQVESLANWLLSDAF